MSRPAPPRRGAWGISVPDEGNPQDPLRHLEIELRSLAESTLLRTPPDLRARAVDTGVAPIVLCSNDYLNFASEPWPIPSEARELPSGAGASRLVSGEHPSHAAAERALADWLHYEAALLFSSGYAANVGLITSLAGPGDVIVSDELNHASIIDGCRLSGAAIAVVPHTDAAAVETALQAAHGARRRWVITESYFSMDGDTPDLGRLRETCTRHDAALLVDEAHALGVFGVEGGGLCMKYNIIPDALVGTLGKAVGLCGAFICSSNMLRTWLWNRARSFVFTTGMSPVLAAAIPPRLAEVRAADARRVHVDDVATRLRSGLARHGVTVAPSSGPILPWIVGASDTALQISRHLRRRDIVVQAIRPPTVPASKARLRITANAAVSRLDLERVLNAVAEVSTLALGTGSERRP